MTHKNVLLIVFIFCIVGGIVFFWLRLSSESSAPQTRRPEHAAQTDTSNAIKPQSNTETQASRRRLGRIG